MKKAFIIFIISACLLQELVAQTGKVGINTTSPAALLHVKDSSVLFTGPATLPATPGNPPVSGAGSRMLWYPAKAAFRSGLVTGTQWDKINIGQYSFSSGYNTIAKGDYSTGFGHTTLASGSQSTSLGSSTQALGTNTTSLGSGSIAKGFNSTAMGVSTQSNGYASTVIGQWNDTIVSSQTTMSGTTPLFIIGKGDNAGSRSNALVVRKDGNIGIGISNPGFLLNFPNATGDKISLWGNSGNHFGFGIQTSLLQIHTDNNLGDIAFGYGSSTSFTETMRIKGNGKVGIGTSTPAYPLNFANSVGDKISLWGADVFHYGFGIQNQLLQIHTSAAGEDIAFGHGNSATFTETMRIKGNGNVGIGIVSPGFKLDVAGRARVRSGGSIGESAGIYYNKVDNSGVGGFVGMHSDDYIGLYSDLGAGWGLVMHTATGNIGIGTTTPGFPLNFSNILGDKISLWGNSGAHYGIGVQSLLLQIHSDIAESDIAFGYGSSTSFNETMRIKGNGKVGIGVSSPGFPLNFPAVTGDKISLWGNSGAHYGFGIQSGVLQIHTSGPGEDVVFGFGSSASFTETMRIKGNGNVGIGTNVPSRPLHVRYGTSGATGITNSVGLFENSTNAYLNILTPNVSESGLIFGNVTSASSGGIVYNSSPTTNGLQFRANGNITQMVITNTGSVGIGATSPATKLHVRNGSSGVNPSSSDMATFEHGTDNAFINVSAPANKSTGIKFNHPAGTDSGAIIYNQGSLSEGFRFQSGTSTVLLTINSLGKVGIGTSVQTEELEVAGTAKFAGLHVTGDGDFDRVVLASCGILSCSDVRYKKNIYPLTNSLSSILSLDGIYYNWDNEKFPDKCFTDQRQVGIIAQELEKYFPELVNTDRSGFKTVDYSRMTPILLEAIKEQQVMINSQDEKINTLSKLFETQQEQINFLMREVIELKQNSNAVGNRESE